MRSALLLPWCVQCPIPAEKNLVVTASETDWLQRSINPLSGPLLCNWKLTGAHFFHFYLSSVFPVFLTCSGSFFSVVPSTLLSWVLCWQADTNPCDFHTRDAESERKGQGTQERGKEEKGRVSARERLARDDSWHRVWKNRVMAERAMEKANQQLVTPYITLRGGLLGIDFRDHGWLTVDVWVINRRMKGWSWIVEGCRKETEWPGWEYQQSSSRGAWGMSGSTL